MATIPTGRFVWFEYVAKDVHKAQGFFGELFGWKTQQMPATGGAGSDYTMITADTASIGGYMPTPEGAPKHAHWISHLQVADAHAIAAKVKAAGGKVLKEVTKMGDFGTWAMVADPFGGAFALWQPGKPEGTGDFKDKVGTWCWNELMTDQPEKSVEFYKQVGGFEHEAMDMGPMGTYHLLKSDGKPRAGIAKAQAPNTPQAWLPYVHVANADQICDRAKKLGAQLKAGPHDIPNTGRYAILQDPLGAAIGILQPAPRHS